MEDPQPSDSGDKVPPYDTRKSWRRFNVVVIVLIIGLAVVFAYVYGQRSAQQLATKAGPAPTPTIQPPTTESLSEQLIISKSQPGGSPITPYYTLSLQVPTVWRTVDIRSSTDLNDWDGFNLNDLLALLRFVPEVPQNSNLTSSLEPTNTLNVLDITSWLTKTSSDVTPRQKQAYINYLEGIKSLPDLKSKVGCQPITTDGASLCEDLQVSPQLVATADGKLKGVAYLTMGHQALVYAPMVEVYLAGTINGQTIYASGNFNIYDQTYHQLLDGGANQDGSQILAAVNRFKDGDVQADTKTLYQHVTDAVKSIRLTPVNNTKP